MINILFCGNDKVFDGVSVAMSDGAEVCLLVNDLKDATDAKVTVSVEGGEPVELTGVKENGRWRFVLPIEPWQMSDTLVFRYDSDLAEIHETFTTSVREYCEYLIAISGNKTLIALAKSMLHYGAVVQKQMGYRTDDLANAGISPFVAEELTGSVPYLNPDEDVYGEEELTDAISPTVRVTVEPSITGVDRIVYRVSGRYYDTGEYEWAAITDGKAEIPLAVHELGRAVNIRIFDGLGAWKEIYRVSGFHCLVGAEKTELNQALLNYAKYADAYVYGDR